MARLLGRSLKHHDQRMPDVFLSHLNTREVGGRRAGGTHTLGRLNEPDAPHKSSWARYGQPPLHHQRRTLAILSGEGRDELGWGDLDGLSTFAFFFLRC